MNDAPNEASLGIGAQALIGLLLVASSASLYFGLRAALADAVSMQSRWQITQWQSGKSPLPKVIEWGAARNDLVAALHWTPNDPQLHEYLGYLYGLRATSSRAIPELEQAMLADSVSYFRQAVVNRPMSPYAWVNLSLALHLQGGQDEALWQAWERAWQYGNREAGVQRTLAEIGFARWKEAGTARQAKLIDMIDNARPHSKGDLLAIAKRFDKSALLKP